MMELYDEKLEKIEHSVESELEGHAGLNGRDGAWWPNASDHTYTLYIYQLP